MKSGKYLNGKKLNCWEYQKVLEEEGPKFEITLRLMKRLKKG